MQAEEDIKIIAHRVLLAVETGKLISQRDSYALRMWAKPGTRLRPLQEIATEVIFG